jgi:hypothetical protein
MTPIRDETTTRVASPDEYPSLVSLWSATYREAGLIDSSTTSFVDAYDAAAIGVGAFVGGQLVGCARIASPLVVGGELELPSSQHTRFDVAVDDVEVGRLCRARREPHWTIVLDTCAVAAMGAVRFGATRVFALIESPLLALLNRWRVPVDVFSGDSTSPISAFGRPNLLVVLESSRLIEYASRPLTRAQETFAQALAHGSVRR